LLQLFLARAKASSILEGKGSQVPQDYGTTDGSKRPCRFVIHFSSLPQLQGAHTQQWQKYKEDGE
jgi:hypothetical protein